MLVEKHILVAFGKLFQKYFRIFHVPWSHGLRIFAYLIIETELDKHQEPMSQISGEDS